MQPFPYQFPMSCVSTEYILNLPRTLWVINILILLPNIFPLPIIVTDWFNHFLFKKAIESISTLNLPVLSCNSSDHAQHLVKTHSFQHMKPQWNQSQATSCQVSSRGRTASSDSFFTPRLLSYCSQQEEHTKWHSLCSGWQNSEGGHRRNHKLHLASSLSVDNQEQLQQLQQERSNELNSVAASSCKSPTSSL